MIPFDARIKLSVPRVKLIPKSRLGDARDSLPSRFTHTRRRDREHRARREFSRDTRPTHAARREADEVHGPAQRRDRQLVRPTATDHAAGFGPSHRSRVNTEFASGGRDLTERHNG